jgi:hypothetical protein
MKALPTWLTTHRIDRRASTLTPASASCTPSATASGPGMADVLDMRVGCWRPPVHVTLS